MVKIQVPLSKVTVGINNTHFSILILDYLIQHIDFQKLPQFVRKSQTQSLNRINTSAWTLSQTHLLLK